MINIQIKELETLNTQTHMYVCMYYSLIRLPIIELPAAIPPPASLKAQKNLADWDAAVHKKVVTNIKKHKTPSPIAGAPFRKLPLNLFVKKAVR